LVISLKWIEKLPPSIDFEIPFIAAPLKLKGWGREPHPNSFVTTLPPFSF
jgi:hypothetical protein